MGSVNDEVFEFQLSESEDVQQIREPEGFIDPRGIPALVYFLLAR